MTESEMNNKKPKFIGTPIADSGNKNTIVDESTDDGTVSIKYGFPSKFSTPRGSGGKSVARMDMNGILNTMSSLNYYYQYMGRNPWVEGQSYPQGAKVWYSDAEYVSTVDSNVTTPGATGASWIKLNDLSGTSGGSVECAWAGRSSDISTLLTNAGKIPGIETDIETLQTSVSSISSKLDNLSVKPTFLDFDNAVRIASSDGKAASYLTYTAPSNGRVFVSVETTGLVTGTDIYIGEVTSSSTTKYRIATLYYSGLESASGAGTNHVNRNFDLDIKSGQKITFKFLSATSSDAVTAIFVPHLSS